MLFYEDFFFLNNRGNRDFEYTKERDWMVIWGRRGLWKRTSPTGGIWVVSERKPWKPKPSIQSHERGQEGDMCGSKDKIICFIIFHRPGSSFSFFSQACGSWHLILVKYHQPFLYDSPYLDCRLKEKQADCMMRLKAITEWAWTCCVELRRHLWQILHSLCHPLGTEIEDLQLNVCLKFFI